MKIKHIGIIAGLALLVIVTGIVTGLGFSPKKDQLFSGSSAWQRTTYAKGSGAADQEIYGFPATLERIIIGETNSAGTLMVKDGSTTIFGPWVGITEGVFEVGIDFDTNILATVSSALLPVFIYTPK